MARIIVQSAAFDIAAEIARMADEAGTDCGAIVTFTGLCRSEKGALTALELEHYPGMAEEEIGRIAKIAEDRWPLDAATIIHRYGKITPGEGIVLVLVASAHRAAAFEAAEFMMDYLKTHAPFWKKEHRTDGQEGSWVEAHNRDDVALGRWQD